MADYTVHILGDSGLSWEAFETDWRAQCGDVGEAYDDYASDSITVLRNLANGDSTSVSPLNKNGVAAFRHEADGKIHAVCMLNRATLPGDAHPTLRVRHLRVSPLIDYGMLDERAYAAVLVAAFQGIVQLSETAFVAQSVKFHLRSPGDMDFFRAVGVALDGTKVFASVQMRGAWLYVNKVSTAVAEGN